MISSMSFGLVRFHSFLMITFSSSFCWSMGPEVTQTVNPVRPQPWQKKCSRAAFMLPPSVLIFRDVRTKANRVALKVTVPSGYSGTFIDTSLCGDNPTETYTPRPACRRLRSRGGNLLYKQRDEDTASQIREAAGSCATLSPRRCVLSGHCDDKRLWTHEQRLVSSHSQENVLLCTSLLGVSDLVTESLKKIRSFHRSAELLQVNLINLFSAKKSLKTKLMCSEHTECTGGCSSLHSNMWSNHWTTHRTTHWQNVSQQLSVLEELVHLEHEPQWTHWFTVDELILCG